MKKEPWDIPSLLGSFEEQIPPYPFDADTSGSAVQQRRWEHRIVGKLLGHFDRQRDAKAMTDVARDELGSPRLTFEIFLRFHPSFPMWLACAKIPYVYKTTLTELVRKLPSTKIYRALVRAELEVPEARSAAVGLVFEWVHFWPTAILHNQPVESDGPDGVLNWKVPKTEQRLVLQSFESYLASLTWRPR